MRIQSLPELLANPPEMPEFVLGPRLLPRKGRCMIFGQSGIGKSMLVHNLAFSLAAGQPWLGFTPPRAYRTLYLLAEGGEYSLWERSMHLQEKRPIDLAVAGPNLHLTFDLNATMSNTGYPDIEAAVLSSKAEVVILDPAYKLMLGSDADAESAKTFIRACDRLIAATGCTLIVVHHSKKAAFDDNGFKVDRGRAEARGHTTFTEDFWDVLFQLKRTKREGHSIVVEKARHSNVETDEPIPLFFNYPLFLRKDEPGAEDPLLALLPAEWTPLAEVRVAVEAGLSLGEKSVRERLRMAKEEGVLEVMPNPARKNENLIRRKQ